MRANLRHYASLASATAFAQGFLVLIAPLLTRVYSPAVFGAFGLLLGIGAVIGTVGTGRLEHAIPVARTTADALSVFVLAVTTLVGVSAVAWIVLGLVEYSGALTTTSWEGLPLLSIPVIAISLAMFQLTGAILIRQKSYAWVAINKIVQGVSTGMLQVVFGLLHMASLGLVLAQVLGYQAGCLGGVRRLWRKLRVIARRRGFALRSTFRAFRRFPLVLAPAALFNQASQYAPLLAIGSIFGLQEAGLYALTQRICGAPLAVIGQAVSQVYASEFRDIHRGGGQAIAHRYRLMVLRLTLIGLVVVGALVIVLKLADEFIFGREWAHVGDVALYVIPMLVSDFATTPISMTLSYLGEQRLQLNWDIGRLGAIVLVFLIVSVASLRFEQGLLLLSTAWAVSLAIHAMMTYKAGQRHEA